MRLIAVFVIGPLLIVGTAVVAAPYAAELADVASADADPIVLPAPENRSVVYAADGTVLAVLHGEFNRFTVPLSLIPEPVINAILAVEDKDFYEHDGVDVSATARAALADVTSGEIEQGGSTITQQLIKNTVLNSDQDVERKIREAALAIRLEDQYEEELGSKKAAKDKILEEYLNRVYFGGGAYGVQAAAEIYWGAPVAFLGYSEAALLASLISSPNNYDPTRSPEVARERRSLALDRMVEEEYLTPAEADEIRDDPLPTARQQVLPPPEDYFVEEVKQQLLDDPRLGETPEERQATLFSGGLEIHTTIDLAAQAQAEQARNLRLPSEPLEVRDPATGELTTTNFDTAIASVEPSTGAVRVMVGGPGFDRVKFNLATQSKNSPGSSFKTFVLATALEQGIVPADTINGSGPCEFENPGGSDYEAENFGNSNGRTTTLEKQTTSSSNCAYLRLGQVVGIENVIETAHRMGITSELLPVLSLPLGSMEVTVLEMASAYATLANDGVHNEPYVIERVTNQAGDTIIEHHTESRRALSRQTARLVTDVLESNVKGGTGTYARPDYPCVDSPVEQPAAGKTGTGQNFKDAYFAGYTPHLATAVWMGSAGETKYEMRGVRGTDRCGYTLVRNVTGGSFPAVIWGEFNTAYHQDREIIAFTDPESTRRGRHIDEDDGLTSNRARSSSSRSSGSSRSGSGRSSSSGSAGGSSGTPTSPTTVDPGTPPVTEKPPPVTQPPPPVTEPPPPVTEPPPPPTTVAG